MHDEGDVLILAILVSTHPGLQVCHSLVESLHSFKFIFGSSFIIFTCGDGVALQIVVDREEALEAVSENTYSCGVPLIPWPGTGRHGI